MHLFTIKSLMVYEGAFLAGGMRDGLLLGTTPQRRDFEYPRILSKTSPHDKIVEEFRKKYIEQEALETALPCDSDSDDDMVHVVVVVYT